MAEIVKVYKQTVPALRLTGKRYPNAERRPGLYAHTWEEWFQKDWFAPLQAIRFAGEEGDAYIGSMRFCGGEREYWIGMFTDPQAAVPEGYAYMDIPAGEIGVLWLKGPDDWNLYNMHNECVAAFQEQGWNVPDDADFFERYTQTRFVSPAVDGTVILDYCVHL